VITPNHVHLFRYVWESQRINAAWSVEWQSILAAWGKPWLGPLAIPTYGAVLVATALAAASTVRRVSLASLAVIAFLALIPLSAFRSVDGAFAPILFLAEQLCVMTHARRASFRFVSLAAPIVTLAAIYPVLGQELHVPGVSFSSRLRPGNDWNRDEFPVGAVTFLDAVNLRGRLYNPAQWGGYLLYRTYTKYPVFIDGRWADYGEDLFKASLAIEYHRPNAFALLDDYHIDILLVPQEWMAQGDPSPQHWIPVFENYSAALFIRDVPANAGDLEKCERYYREHSVPFDRARGFDRRAAFRANPKWAEAMDVDLGLTDPG